jgi:hypothetical protein
MAHWYILSSGIFSCFGMLYREKSGNPGTTVPKFSIKKHFYQLARSYQNVVQFPLYDKNLDLVTLNRIGLNVLLQKTAISAYACSVRARLKKKLETIEI